MDATIYPIGRLQVSRSVPFARRAAALIAILLAAGTIQLAAAPSADASPVGSVTGIVSSSGGPIAGIVVSLPSVGSSFSSTTDLSGSYTILNIPIGSQTLDLSDPSLTWLHTTVVVDITDGNQTVQNVDPLQPRPNHAIQGTVTNSQTGQPVAGLSISSSGSGPDDSRSSVTDANGLYRIDHLLSTSINIATPYNDPLWLSFSRYSIGIVPDAILNFTVTPMPTGPGVISGTVTDHVGHSPVAGATVTIRGNDQYLTGNYGFVANTTTDVNGLYSFANVPTGGIYLNLPGYPSWEPFTATFPLGTAPKVRDVQLAPLTTGTGTITVTMLDGDGPIVGMGVSVAKVNSGSFGSTPTDSLGQFTSTGLSAGTYSIAFNNPGASSGQSVYRTPLLTDLVVVLAAGDTKNVNVTLQKYQVGTGSVHGQVLDSRTGQPVSGLLIYVYPTSTSLRQASATTDSTGHWTADHLADGEYVVDMLTSAYETAVDTPTLVILGGQSVTRVDHVASVVAGSAGISGYVRDSSTHLGLPGARISISRNLGGYPVPTATAGSAGGFTASNLPAGEYGLTVSLAGYVTSHVSVELGTSLVTLTVPLVKQTNLGAAIPDGVGSVSGTVVDSLGLPVSGALIFFRLPGDTGQQFGYTPSDTDGHFEYTGLPLTTLVLRADGPFAAGGIYAPAIQDLAFNAANRDLTGVVVTMQPAGSISGTVTYQGGGVPEGVRASVYDSTTGALKGAVDVGSPAGTYRIANLVAGTYLLKFAAGSEAKGSASSSPITVAPAYWAGGTSGSATAAAGTTITIAAGQNIAPRDIVLGEGGAITGRVRVLTADGPVAPPPGKYVIITPYLKVGSTWVAMDSAVASASRFHDGEFLVNGLAAGQYRLQFADGSSGNRALQPVYSGGASTLADATLITVTSAGVTTIEDTIMEATKPAAAPGSLNIADLPPDSESALENQITTDPTAIAGKEVTIDLGEEYAGEWVAAWANSTPTRMSDWVRVGADGTFTALVPNSLVGNHRIVVEDADEQALGWAPITVAAPAVTTTPHGTNSGSGTVVPSVPATPIRHGTAAPTAGPTSVITAPASPRPTPTPGSNPTSSPAASAPSSSQASLNWVLIVIVLVFVLALLAGVAVFVARRRA